MHHQSVHQHRTTLRNLICMYLVNHQMTILSILCPCPCAPWTKSVRFQYIPCAPPKGERCWGWPLLKKRSPLCTIVHSAGWWCTVSPKGIFQLTVLGWFSPGLPIEKLPKLPCLIELIHPPWGYYCAQRRSTVHNIALYHRSGAQRSFLNRQTDARRGPM